MKRCRLVLVKPRGGQTLSIGENDGIKEVRNVRRKTRDMVQIAAWFPGPVGRAIKQELRQFQEKDYRLTQSRILGDALRMYFPILRAELARQEPSIFGLKPPHEEPAPQNTAVGA